MFFHIHIILFIILAYIKIKHLSFFYPLEVSQTLKYRLQLNKDFDFFFQPYKIG